MLLLTTTSDKIQLITASAVSTIYSHATWVDNVAGVATAGRLNLAITSNATTDVVASPTGTNTRNVQTLAFFNSHATSSNLVTLQHTDGSTVSKLFAYTLLAGETLEWLNGVGLRVIDSSGCVKTGTGSQTTQQANQYNLAINGVVDSYIKPDTHGYIMFGVDVNGGTSFIGMEYICAVASAAQFAVHYHIAHNASAANIVYTSEVHTITDATAGSEDADIAWYTYVAGANAIRASIKTGVLTTAAGTTALAAFAFTSGTLLTVAAAGKWEYDGVSAYFTNDTTNGRAQNVINNTFRLTGSGSGITTIADFFGANSAIPLVANGVYEIEWDCYFSQATAGTATWTITTATTALANLTAEYVGSPIAGIGTAGTPQTAAVNVTSSSATALPVTGTEATGVTHYFKVKARLTAGNGTSNVRLRLTMSAGTATPLINSGFKVRRMPAANTGAFVA